MASIEIVGKLLIRLSKEQKYPSFKEAVRKAWKSLMGGNLADDINEAELVGKIHAVQG